MIIGLSVALGLFAIELIGFLGGITMFTAFQSLLCILLQYLTGSLMISIHYLGVSLVRFKNFDDSHISVFQGIHWSPFDLHIKAML